MNRTGEGEGLPDRHRAVEAGLSQVIRQLTADNRQHGAADVRKSRQQTVLRSV